MFNCSYVHGKKYKFWLIRNIAEFADIKNFAINIKMLANDFFSVCGRVL